MDCIVWEDADCVHDEILARRPKRRLLGIRESEIYPFSLNSKRVLADNWLGNGMDEDYMTFINLLREYCESRDSERHDSDNGDDSDDEEDLEPDYKMFLENCKEDEKSYVLQVATDIMMKYEAVGVSDDEREPLTMRKSRKVPDREKAVKDLTNIPTKDKMKYVAVGGMDDEREPLTMRKSRKVPDREKAVKDLRNIPRTDKRKYEAVGGSDDECERLAMRKSRKVPDREKAVKDLRNIPTRDKTKYEAVRGSDDEREPLTMRKPRMVRDREKAVKKLRNIPTRDKMKYEAVRGSNDEREPLTMRKSRMVRDREKAVKDLRNLPTRDKMKYEAVGGSDDEREPLTMRKSRMVPDREKAVKDLRNIPRKDKMGAHKNPFYVVRKDVWDSTKGVQNVAVKEIRDLVVGRDLKSEFVNHVPGKVAGRSPKPSPKANNLYGIEVDYLTFLSGYVLKGDYLVSQTEDGKPLKYEGYDGERYSDPEIFMTSNASDFNKGNYNPFQTSKLFYSFMEEDEQQCLGNPVVGKLSEFREKLMGKLREPYDQKEYEKLWQIINEQTLKDGRHRDLRGQAALKSYSTDQCNPSYLENHSGLKKKINAIKFDRRKVLYLLRGFFFWLKNLAYEDSFQPWLDPSCLALMPRNR